MRLKFKKNLYLFNFYLGYRHEDDAPGSPGSSGVRSPQSSSMESSMNSSSGSLHGPLPLFDSLQLRDVPKPKTNRSSGGRQRRTPAAKNAPPNDAGGVLMNSNANLGRSGIANDANHHSVIEERSDGNFVLKIKKNAILGVKMQQQSNSHKRTRRKAGRKLFFFFLVVNIRLLGWGLRVWNFEVLIKPEFKNDWNFALILYTQIINKNIPALFRMLYGNDFILIFAICKKNGSIFYRSKTAIVFWYAYLNIAAEWSIDCCGAITIYMPFINCHCFEWSDFAKTRTRWKYFAIAHQWFTLSNRCQSNILVCAKDMFRVVN